MQLGQLGQSSLLGKQGQLPVIGPNVDINIIQKLQQLQHILIKQQQDKAAQESDQVGFF